jgi:hypothetical protein
MPFIAIGGYGPAQEPRCPRPPTLRSTLEERVRSASRLLGVEAAAAYLALAGRAYYLVLASSRSPVRLSVLRLELLGGGCLKEELWWPLVYTGPADLVEAFSREPPPYLIVALISGGGETGAALGELVEGAKAYPATPLHPGSKFSVIVAAERIEEWAYIHRSLGRIEDLVAGVRVDLVANEIERVFMGGV